MAFYFHILTTMHGQNHIEFVCPKHVYFSLLTPSACQPIMNSQANYSVYANCRTMQLSLPWLKLG